MAAKRFDGYIVVNLLNGDEFDRTESRDTLAATKKRAVATVKNLIDASYGRKDYGVQIYGARMEELALKASELVFSL
jgi:hypothetical protein